MSAASAALAEMACRIRRAKRLAPDSAIVTDCALIIDNARRALLEAAAIEARHQGDFA